MPVVRQVRGDLVVFEHAMGMTGFVSHQWVRKEHPDPGFQRMRVLQDVLRKLLYSKGSVPLDAITESVAPSAKPIPFEEFQSQPFFLWYDYFSVPQLGRVEDEMAKAIASIPAYVSRCRHFFALCPTIACEDRVLNLFSWSRRGWCRLERCCRELSEHDNWVLIQGATSVEVVGTTASLEASPVGLGAFTQESDRARLAPVMRAVVRRKLMLSLVAGDFEAYRRHLNLQSVYLQGFDLEPVRSLLPADEQDEVDGFLHQNGLTDVNLRDAAGWWPLHYAALAGRLSVVSGLLKRRAEPNNRSFKDQPQLGFAPLVSALDLALTFKHNEVASALLAARAELHRGLLPDMTAAAQVNNVEGIKLLCAAGGDVRVQNLFGFSALQVGAGFGALAAVEEIHRQVPHSRLELSKALFFATSYRGGSAEMVNYLISLKADVDFQWDVRRDMSRFGRLFTAAQALRHSFSQGTALSAVSYHYHGKTPLMAAIHSAQHEAAAALIAAGAKLDTANCRGWRAADFARGQCMPDWLQQGLAGNASECQRVCSFINSSD